MRELTAQDAWKVAGIALRLAQENHDRVLVLEETIRKMSNRVHFASPRRRCVGFSTEELFPGDFK